MEYYGLDWIPGCVNLSRTKVIKGKKAKNKIMERLFFLCIALSLAALVGKWGSTRKIGFGWAFGLSVINLFVGIIAVACSKKLDVNSSVTKEIEK